MNKGLTVIELVAILVIMGIISGLAYLGISNVIENSRIKADEANLVVLNQATDNYIFNEGLENEDAFSGINSDYFRIEHLYLMGYLDKIIIASQSEAEFRWNVDEQVWDLIGGENIYNDYGNEYDFSEMTLQDAIDDGATIANPRRVTYDPEDGFVTIEGPVGILMQDTSSDEYSFSFTFSTENLDTAIPMFYFDYYDESNLGDGEGFAVLISKELEEINIYSVVNGRDLSIIERYDYTSSGIIPSNASDPNWYGEIHTIEFDITRKDSSTKNVEIYIDNEFLIDFDYNAVSTSNPNYYGISKKARTSDIYVHKFVFY